MCRGWEGEGGDLRRVIEVYAKPIIVFGEFLKTPMHSRKHGRSPFVQRNAILPGGNVQCLVCYDPVL